MTKYEKILLIAPEGIEIVYFGSNIDIRIALLIAPEGIEISAPFYSGR